MNLKLSLHSIAAAKGAAPRGPIHLVGLVATPGTADPALYAPEAIPSLEPGAEPHVLDDILLGGRLRGPLVIALQVWEGDVDLGSPPVAEGLLSDPDGAPIPGSPEGAHRAVRQWVERLAAGIRGPDPQTEGRPRLLEAWTIHIRDQGELERWANREITRDGDTVILKVRVEELETTWEPVHRWDELADAIGDAVQVGSEEEGWRDGVLAEVDPDSRAALVTVDGGEVVIEKLAQVRVAAAAEGDVD